MLSPTIQPEALAWPSSILYHEGSRGLQDAFESRRIADRLEARTTHTEFTEGDAGFIEGASFFFLATADREGRPDVSFKGGMPGFVRVAGPSELVFPDYDGNGMFKSLGNIAVNPNVALLFINFERPRPAPHQRDGGDQPRRPAPRPYRRRPDDRAGQAAGDLSELPALHPDHAGGRAVDLRAAAGRSAGRAGMEILPGLRRRDSPAPEDGDGGGTGAAVSPPLTASA